MAAFIGHRNCLISITGKLQLLQIFNASSKNILRFKSNGRKSTKPPPIIKDKFEWSQESLAARGFLRPLKPYAPQPDVSEKLDVVCKTQGISSNDSTIINDLLTRFKVFTACENEFNYAIPNSILYTIETIGDLRQFYSTPIDTTLPFDAMKKSNLPKNLHIQHEYHRFHPDTDTKFDGKTAFPRSSTLVTGLKYKKKYPSLIQKSPFADN